MESLICHYPGFCQECETWLVWREMFLSATNKETSEQQIPHVAQRLSQAAEMPEFSCKPCWGTSNDHSCEGLGLLFHRRHGTFKTAPLPVLMRPWVWGRKRCILSLTLLPATLTHPPLPIVTQKWPPSSEFKCSAVSRSSAPIQGTECMKFSQRMHEEQLKTDSQLTENNGDLSGTGLSHKQGKALRITDFSWFLLASAHLFLNGNSSQHLTIYTALVSTNIFPRVLQ